MCETRLHAYVCLYGVSLCVSVLNNMHLIRYEIVALPYRAFLSELSNWRSRICHPRWAIRKFYSLHARNRHTHTFSRRAYLWTAIQAKQIKIHFCLNFTKIWLHHTHTSGNLQKIPWRRRPNETLANSKDEEKKKYYKKKNTHTAHIRNIRSLNNKVIALIHLQWEPPYASSVVESDKYFPSIDNNSCIKLLV